MLSNKEDIQVGTQCVLGMLYGTEPRCRLCVPQMLAATSLNELGEPVAGDTVRHYRAAWVVLR